MIDRQIKRDDVGIEGIPYLLIIISIVLAITIPVIYSTWSYYDTQSTIEEANQETAYIGQRAEQLFIRGEGNADTIDVTLSGGLFADIEYIEIGGEHSDIIEWKIDSDNRGRYILPDNMYLIPYEEDGFGNLERLDEMLLTRTRYTLRLTCVVGDLDEVEDGKTRYIRVEKI